LNFYKAAEGHACEMHAELKRQNILIAKRYMPKRESLQELFDRIELESAFKNLNLENKEIKPVMQSILENYDNFYFYDRFIEICSDYQYIPILYCFFYIALRLLNKYK
jgi:hypothetical protein